MSGGHFDYKQYTIGNIADQIDEIIQSNNSTLVDEDGNEINYSFNQNTIDEFKYAVILLRKAMIYAHRIDWLVSGDDGETNFHERLATDLDALVSLPQPTN